MALNKPALEVAIFQAFKDQTSKTSNPDAAISDLANKLASAIDTFVKTGTVDSPIPVTVAVPAGTGGTTAPGTIS